MLTDASRSEAPALSDDHSILLWQTCAYADDLIEAARAGRPVTHAHDAILEFAHYRLLPYLAEEERCLAASQLRDNHFSRLLYDDHARIRHGVDNLDTSRTRGLLAVAAGGLVERLDRHIRREETWVIPDPADSATPATDDWALPLLLSDEIDIDALPDEARMRLLLQRLRWMRDGEAIHLQSSHDLRQLWIRSHALDPGSHAWVYEQEGPALWRVRVTRRTEDDWSAPA